MHAVPPVIVDQAHTVTAYVDLPTVISNCFNVMVVGNKRPYFAAGLKREKQTDDAASTVGVLHSLLELSAGPIDDWLIRPGVDPAKMQFGAESDPGIQDAHISWIKMLTSRPTLHANMGERIVQLVSAMPDDVLSKEYVATPSLGYARPYYTLGLSQPSCEFGLRLPALQSRWSRQLATLLMILDLARFTPQLIPDLSTAKISGHDFKSRPIGQTLAFVEQLNEIMDIPMLYLLQGSLLMLHVYKDFNAWRAEHAAARDPRASSALAARNQLESFLLGLPTHPFVSYVASMFRRGSLRDYFGTDVALYPLAAGVQHEKNSDGKVTVRQLASIGGQLVSKTGAPEAVDFFYVQEALRDQTSAGTRTEVWGYGPKDDAATVSYGELARQVQSLGDGPLKRWPNLARALGWSGLTAGPVRLEQAGGSFLLTDGRRYSEDPTAALAGMKPCLAISNLRFSGRERRFDSDWNTKIPSDTERGKTSLIQWNVLVVEGFQTPIDGADVYMRTYMPSGMLMGEPDVQFLLPPAIETNPVLESVIEAYAARSPQYVKMNYAEPAGKHSQFWATDWDGYGYNHDRETANNALAAGYTGQTESAKTTAYAFHDRFFHRVPVKMALLEVSLDVQPSGVAKVYPRNGTGQVYFECYDPTGRLWANLRQDGHVAYSHGPDITVGDSTAPLEALVQMLPVGKPLAVEFGEQVKVVEPIGS